MTAGRYRHSIRARWRVWLAAGCALAAASAAPAAEPGTAAEKSPEIERPAAETDVPEPRTGAGGLRVYLDPETGEITDRPTREQVEALSRALETSFNKSAEGLRFFELERGGRGVHLGERFRSATVVRRRADGSFETHCVDRPEDAAEILRGEAPAATAGVEK